MKELLLEVKALKKYFPIYSGLLRRQTGEIKAVDGIDFKIAKGEVLGLVGESGSGKSTAGRAAIRLIEPTSGELYFLGKNLAEFEKKELLEARKKIQIIFQDPYTSLNPRKTVLQNVGEVLLYHKLVKDEEEQKAYVVEILKKVGLSSEALFRYPHQFSGGQQQRICIGRAIIMNPNLIVCDEAVSALDVSVQAQILNLLVELKETLGFSYLFISHNLSVIRYISDFIMVMHRGKIVEGGEAQNIFENPQAEYTKKLLSAIPANRPRRF